MLFQVSTDFDNIKEKLLYLSYTLEANSKLNLLDQHLWSENFLSEFLSLVYGHSFVNLNARCSNFPGGDLVDHNRKIVVQVSTNTSKSKKDSTVENISKNSNFSNYEIWFVALVTKSPKKVNSKIKYKDLNCLLKDIQNLPQEKIKKISVLCNRALRTPTAYDSKKTFDIAKIINILSSMNISSECNYDNQPFKIQDKIAYNKLEDLHDYIDDFLVYEGKIKNIYDEYDKEGTNKSLFVLNYINLKYLRLKNTGLTSKDLFFKLMEELTEDVISSEDYKKQSIESLQFCLGIILVDAFVKCRIFDRPK